MLKICIYFFVPKENYPFILQMHSPLAAQLTHNIRVVSKKKKGIYYFYCDYNIVQLNTTCYIS